MRDATASSASAAGLRAAIVVSRYHGEVTSALRDGAAETFVKSGGAKESLSVIEAPGAFELTAICSHLANLDRHDLIVALACIIEGETAHDQVLAHAVAHGLTQITINTGIPIAFGVLTCKTIEQARARAGGDKGNKGAEAMAAAIETAAALRKINSTKGAL